MQCSRQPNRSLVALTTWVSSDDLPKLLHYNLSLHGPCGVYGVCLNSFLSVQCLVSVAFKAMLSFIFTMQICISCVQVCAFVFVWTTHTRLELVSCSVAFILSSEVPRKRRPEATPHLHVVPKVTMRVSPPSLHALAFSQRRRCLWASWDSPVTLPMFFQSTL
jgi:hypothetical protein